jgi:hypothetical protein
MFRRSSWPLPRIEPRFSDEALADSQRRTADEQAVAVKAASFRLPQQK